MFLGDRPSDFAKHKLWGRDGGVASLLKTSLKNPDLDRPRLLSTPSSFLFPPFFHRGPEFPRTNSACLFTVFHLRCVSGASLEPTFILAPRFDGIQANWPPRPQAGRFCARRSRYLTAEPSLDPQGRRRHSHCYHDAVLCEGAKAEVIDGAEAARGHTSCHEGPSLSLPREVRRQTHRPQ